MLAASFIKYPGMSQKILAGSFAWMSMHKPRRATFRGHDAGSNPGRHPLQKSVSPPTSAEAPHPHAAPQAGEGQISAGSTDSI